MEKQTEQLKNWYTEYKENKLKNDIKRCNSIAVAAGSVATLSSLIVAGNLVLGNGIEALQTGGSMAAMVCYVVGNLKMKESYKKDLAATLDEKENPKTFLASRLETLKYELEIYKTSLTMDKLVAGGFYLSTLGHILELISIPTAPAMVTSIACSALSGFVATMYLLLTKQHKKLIKRAEEESEKIGEIKKLEDQIITYLPEILENKEELDIQLPSEILESRTVRLGKLRHSK